QHGQNGPMNAPQAIASSATPTEPVAPRALPVDDPNAKPIQVRDQTVLGEDDQYNAVGPKAQPVDNNVKPGSPVTGGTAAISGTAAAPNSGTAADPSQKPDVPVRRADPVGPTVDSNIKLDPPPPQDF
ncbi:MAG TPA: hypothetical protein VG733_03050, partial [Chthoniobacteraceae bacterium]|nr:hypothetical protein [Chthoniobacteraceae bacterium]